MSPNSNIQKKRIAQAILLASEWLINDEFSSKSIEQVLQQFLVIKGLYAIRLIRKSAKRRKLNELVASLNVMSMQNYTGDPLLPLIAYSALNTDAIKSETLQNFIEKIKLILSDYDINQDPELTLPYYLINFHENKKQDIEIDLLIPSVEDIVSLGRHKTLRLCNFLTLSTACGQVSITELQRSRLTSVLPALSVSYARDADLETVCAVLRICAYLGIVRHRACEWSMIWILNQQNQDGRFGLFIPEAQRENLEPDDRSLYLLPTLRAIWALIEIIYPGFLIRT